MAFEFKKLSDVEVVEIPADTANVLIEENGIIKKAPKTAVGGDKADMIIQVIFENEDSEPVVSIISGSYDELAQKIDNMESALVRIFVKWPFANANGMTYPFNIGKEPYDDGSIVIAIGTNNFYFIIFPDNTIIID